MIKDKLFNISGWIGSILLAICSVPDLISTIQTGKTVLEWPLLLIWFFGEVFVLIPILFKLKSKFLLFNYGVNIISLMIIILYKLEIFPF